MSFRYLPTHISLWPLMSRLLVGLSNFIKGGKLHFHAPIGALVFQYLQLTSWDWVTSSIAGESTSVASAASTWGKPDPAAAPGDPGRRRSSSCLGSSPISVVQAMSSHSRGRGINCRRQGYRGAEVGGTEEDGGTGQGLPGQGRAQHGKDAGLIMALLALCTFIVFNSHSNVCPRIKRKERDVSKLYFYWQIKIWSHLFWHELHATYTRPTSFGYIIILLDIT